MMRVHTVPESTVRAAGFAFSESIRFPRDRVEFVADPRDADVILPGVDLMACQDRETFLRVPCVRDFESRVVLHDCADNYTLYGTPAILIRGNLSTARLADSPNSLCLGWPVEDLSKPVKDTGQAVPLVPPGGFTHDVGFHGWTASKPTRANAYDSCARTFGERFDGAAYPDFAGYLWYANGTPKPEWLRRRRLFMDSMTRCRVQLCPESIDGVLPYRFLESIAAGRVACLVGSNYVLPWREDIRYEDFCLFVPERDAYRCGEVIREFLSGETDATLAERGAKARTAFVRWLNVGPNATDWPGLCLEAVERKARALGLVRE